MGDARQAWSDDELAQHGEWLRGLASALVRDPGAAEDLAQDAWVVRGARELPRDEVRPFLAGVVRRLASQWRRSRSRTDARERDSAKQERTPSSAELLERVEAQELVLRALKGLPEAYRDALILRYYEGLEIDAIARRSGAPAGTVRSRLSRGLAELRARLDRSHRTGRDGWMLALLPIARPRHVAAAGATSVGVLGVMGSKWIAAACVAVLTGVVWFWGHDGAPAEPELAAAEQAELDAPSFSDEHAPGDHAPAAAADRSALASTARQGPSEPVAAARIVGRVLGANFEPLAGARVSAGTEEFVLSDSRGEFELALSEPPRVQPVPLRVEARAHTPCLLPIEVAVDATTWVGDIELEGAGALVGTVVDPSGAAVAGARVIATRASGGARPDEFELATAPRANSDALGRFAFDALASGPWTIWTSSADRPWSCQTAVQITSGSEARITLRAAGIDPSRSIAGVVLDPAGAALEGAQVQLADAQGQSSMELFAVSDALGRFEFHIEGSGSEFSLFARDAHYSYAPVELSSVRLGTIALEIRFAAPALLRVRVLDPEGLPVRRASVHAANSERELVTGCSGESDEQGLASLRRPTHPFSVFAVASGFSAGLVGPFEPGSEPAEIVVQLVRAAAVRGRVVADGGAVADAEVALFPALEPGEARVPRHWLQDIEPFSELRDVRASAVTRSAADGSFALSLPKDFERAPHGWYVVARAPLLASSVAGPLTPDLRSGHEGLVLRLSRGGRIEGSVRRSNGGTAGLLVWARNGLGGDARCSVGPDGSYRLEHLAPGEWQVRVATLVQWGPEAVFAMGFGDEWSGETRRSARPPRFDVVVHEGQTARLDLDEPLEAQWLLRGSLSVGAEPRGAWLALLLDESVQRDFEHHEQRWLDPEGRFALRLDSPGPWRLELVSEDPRWGRVRMVERLTPGGAELRWSAELAFARVTGRALTLRGLVFCESEPMPGRTLSAAFETNADGSFRDVWVPAGRVRFVDRSQSPVRVLRALDLQPGEHAALELP